MWVTDLELDGEVKDVFGDGNSAIDGGNLKNWREFWDDLLVSHGIFQMGKLKFEGFLGFF